MHPKIPAENEIIGLPTHKYMWFLFKAMFQVSEIEKSWRAARFAFSNASKQASYLAIGCASSVKRQQEETLKIERKQARKSMWELTQHTRYKFYLCFL